MTWEEMESNVEPMTPETVARRLVARHGQDAAREALALADGYFQAGMREPAMAHARAAEKLERHLPTRQ